MHFFLHANKTTKKCIQRASTKNVPRSTLLHANKTTKKCIQFLIEIVLFILISSIDYDSYFAFLDNSFTSRVAQNAFDIDAIPNKV